MVVCILLYWVSFIQQLFSCSVMSTSLQPHGLQHQASLFFTISRSLLKLVSIESVMPSNHLIPCCPLLLLPSIFPSIGVFSSELVLSIRCPKCWSFSFSISPSNEYLGLISFKIDWLRLCQAQCGTEWFFWLLVLERVGLFHMDVRLERTLSPLITWTGPWLREEG